MRIGVKLPHTGAAEPTELAARAKGLEDAGFDSLWVGDHVVQPTRIRSPYPFTADGNVTWATDTPYIEAVVALAAAAAATGHIGLGTAALVLPQRNPVLLAKQLASVDAIAGGRLCLGVGAGWLREEFDALDAPFDGRGARFTEWIELLRSCWTGRPPEFRGAHYILPADTLVLPTPARMVPILVAGHSPVALRRAGRIGDGWLAQQSLPELDPAALAVEIGQVRSAAVAADRDPDALTVVLRLVGSADRAAEAAAALPALAAAGVAEVIVDSIAPSADHRLLRKAIA